MTVLWLGQRVVAAGSEGTVAALEVPCDPHAPKGVGVRYDWLDGDPDWLRDSYISFPYRMVRPL